MSEELKVLGREVRAPIREIDTFKAPNGIGPVKFICSEFTSVCPVTGQPDYSTITITYQPEEKCIESKSLKLFLWGYREKGVFCEALAAELCEKLFETVHPGWIEIRVDQSPRGGIKIVAKATRYGNDSRFLDDFRFLDDIDEGDSDGTESTDPE